LVSCFFFQAEDGIRDFHVTGVQTCALPIYLLAARSCRRLGRGLLPVEHLVEQARPRLARGLRLARRPRLARRLLLDVVELCVGRSEERRVGKECGGGWAREVCERCRKQW